MKRGIFVGIMILGFIVLTITAGYATPNFGSNCSMCHINPIVENLDIPATYDSMTVPINAFEATDTDSAKSSKAGIDGYLLTESPDTPSASNSGWSSSPPVSYTFTALGTNTLYAWVKDPIGNVSVNVISASVDITSPNNPPIAEAGSYPAVSVGDTVSLDGSGSSDEDGDPLTFQWVFTSVPGGSQAAFSDPTSVDPTFVVDVPGEYTVELVVNDGTVDSAVVTASITTINIPPVAVIAPGQPAFVGSTITLDGSGSSDEDGDPLAFQWVFTSVPGGSQAAFSDPTSVNPTFVVDVPGEYTVELVVNDGTVDSPSGILTISTQNSPPVAVINLDQTAFTGDTVNLNGSGSSDADGDSLTFLWSLDAAPDGSTAVLSDPAIADPNFVADIAGDYIVSLIVNDGTQDSPSDSVSLSVSFVTDPPTDQPPTDQPPTTEPPTTEPPTAEPPLDEPLLSDGGDTHENDDDSVENDDHEAERSWRTEKRFKRSYGNGHNRYRRSAHRERNMSFNYRDRD